MSQCAIYLSVGGVLVALLVVMLITWNYNYCGGGRWRQAPMSGRDQPAPPGPSGGNRLDFRGPHRRHPRGRRRHRSQSNWLARIG